MLLLMCLHFHHHLFYVDHYSYLRTSSRLSHSKSQTCRDMYPPALKFIKTVIHGWFCQKYSLFPNLIPVCYDTKMTWIATHSLKDQNYHFSLTLSCYTVDIKNPQIYTSILPRNIWILYLELQCYYSSSYWQYYWCSIVVIY